MFPRDPEFGAYVLSDMADYGPQSQDEFFSIEGLTRFFQDCLKAADADSAVVWSDFDVIFIVHAGSDWQNDVLGNTPYDLPTFSITVSDSDVVVSDTADTLTTGIVFPETSSQDGFQVALNGAIAHEMGHQLGLFDLYNVETFAPTVGFYDLMDSGNLTSVLIPNPANGEETEVIGVLPSCPGAWSRWLVLFRFGIDPPLVKEDAPRSRLLAIQSRVPETGLPAATQKWYRLPISDTEYFMVENRVDDLDGRDAQGNFNTALDQDDSTGVVLGPINATTDEPSHNYDLLLDPGVLIWHVDERQVLANFSQGRGLNVFYEKRGVTIEEADGIVDIGSPYSEFFLGTDKETFHAGNNANFSPTTRPNSDSNLGSPSNISVLNIGPRAETIPMDFAFSSKPRGWPMDIGLYGTAGLTSVTAADVDGDGRAEIAATSDSTVFLFRDEDRDGDGEVDMAGAWPQPSNGARLRGNPAFTQVMGNLDADARLEILATTDSGAVHVWNDDGTVFGTADSTGVLLAFPPEEYPAAPALTADLDDDGVAEVYVVTAARRLRGYDFSSGTPESTFASRPLLTAAPDSGSVFAPAFAFGDLGGDGRADGLVGFVEGDSLHVQLFDRDGVRGLRRSFPLPAGHGARRLHLAMADLDRNPADNALELVFVLDSGRVLVADREGNVLPGWPIDLPPPIAGPPAFGDVDGDGLLEIVLGAGGLQLSVLNYNATQAVGWPIMAQLADFPGDGLPIPGPVVCDVDGDGRQDVVAGFVDFTVRAYNGSGQPIDGFPIVTGAAVRSTPAIVDANGDGRLELFVQSTDGQVYARTLAGLASAENPAWGMLGGGPALSGAFDARRLPNLAAASSDVLQGPVTIFPNPAHDEEITIRYTLGTGLSTSTGVEISIYNVAGELVEHMNGTTFANTENVARIARGKLASGTYFCALRARSGDREDSHLEKLAVIR